MIEYHGHGWVAILTDDTLTIEKPKNRAEAQSAVYRVSTYRDGFNIITDSHYDFNKLIDMIECAAELGRLTLIKGGLTNVPYGEN